MPPPEKPFRSRAGLYGAGLSPVPGFMGNRKQAGLTGSSLQGSLALTTADGMAGQLSQGGLLIPWALWKVLGA